MAYTAAERMRRDQPRGSGRGRATPGMGSLPRRCNADRANHRITPGRRGSSDSGAGPQDSLDHYRDPEIRSRIDQAAVDLRNLGATEKAESLLKAIIPAAQPGRTARATSSSPVGGRWASVPGPRGGW